jgi:A/G-specific adenine glycosylase
VYTGPATRRSIRRRLARWYAANGRDLPWRRTRDPYAILVSEVMLQQTQVARVLPAYTAWLVRFPTLAALARASVGDALRAWSGLGYNRRARDLHRIARADPRRLPRDRDGLDALPGIGAYTAGAVACFAYAERVPFADTNIRRVLGRVVLGRVASEREAMAIDAELMPTDAAAWHHALMDLGATLCRSRSPECARCPLREACASADVAEPAAPRRQAAFATSDRRIRGRIVAALRDQDGLSRATLARRVGDARVDRLVRDLAREGLVEMTRYRVRLPG